jgi:alpha-L-fucosidase 2
MAPDLRLWYKEPARVWPNALPIGNGKFGAMVWGQVQKERWQLNEDSVWYGGPQDRNPKDALQYLPELRRLLDIGQLAEAEKLVERAFVAMPESQRHYESLGLANLIFPHKETDARNYKRWLDLETATTSVSYDLGEVRFTRELFASHPANVIAAEFTASTPGMVTFDLRIIRQAGMPIQDRSPDAREMDPQGVDTNIYMDTVTVIDSVLVMKARTGGNGVQMCFTATVTIEGGTFNSLRRKILQF